MKTCQCGKRATHSAYIPPVYFCRECLHNCMEDEDPEVHKSVQEIIHRPLKLRCTHISIEYLPKNRFNIFFTGCEGSPQLAAAIQQWYARQSRYSTE